MDASVQAGQTPVISTHAVVLGNLQKKGVQEVKSKKPATSQRGARWIESFTGKKKTNAEKENVMET